jgi:hypothetical protein
MKSLWVFLVFLIVLGAWMGFNYCRLRRAASVIDNNEEFADKIHGGQLIDLRDPVSLIENTFSEPVIFHINS